MAEIQVRKLKRHVFVCTNARPAGHPRGCCQTRGASEELVQALKIAVRDAGLQNEVRAQKAGCLDACEFGPTVVVYPEGVWYGAVRREDLSEIVQSHLKGGIPVERLRIPGK